MKKTKQTIHFKTLAILNSFLQVDPYIVDRLKMAFGVDWKSNFLRHAGYQMLDFDDLRVKHSEEFLLPYACAIVVLTTFASEGIITMEFYNNCLLELFKQIDNAKGK